MKQRWMAFLNERRSEDIWSKPHPCVSILMVLSTLNTDGIQNIFQVTKRGSRRPLIWIWSRLSFKLKDVLTRIMISGDSVWDIVIYGFPVLLISNKIWRVF